MAQETWSTGVMIGPKLPMPADHGNREDELGENSFAVGDYLFLDPAT